MHLKSRLSHHFSPFIISYIHQPPSLSAVVTCLGCCGGSLVMSLLPHGIPEAFSLQGHFVKNHNQSCQSFVQIPLITFHSTWNKTQSSYILKLSLMFLVCLSDSLTSLFTSLLSFCFSLWNHVVDHRHQHIPAMRSLFSMLLLPEMLSPSYLHSFLSHFS